MTRCLKSRPNRKWLNISIRQQWIIEELSFHYLRNEETDEQLFHLILSPLHPQKSITQPLIYARCAFFSWSINDKKMACGRSKSHHHPICHRLLQLLFELLTIFRCDKRHPFPRVANLGPGIEDVT